MKEQKKCMAIILTPTLNRRCTPSHKRMLWHVPLFMSSFNANTLAALKICLSASHHRSTLIFFDVPCTWLSSKYFHASWYCYVKASRNPWFLRFANAGFDKIARCSWVSRSAWDPLRWQCRWYSLINAITRDQHRNCAALWVVQGCIYRAGSWAYTVWCLQSSMGEDIHLFFDNRPL